jgi:hypothetical protein
MKKDCVDESAQSFFMGIPPKVAEKAGYENCRNMRNEVGSYDIM